MKFVQEADHRSGVSQRWAVAIRDSTAILAIWANLFKSPSEALSDARIRAPKRRGVDQPVAPHVDVTYPVTGTSPPMGGVEGLELSDRERAKIERGPLTDPRRAQHGYLFRPAPAGSAADPSLAASQPPFSGPLPVVPVGSTLPATGGLQYPLQSPGQDAIIKADASRPAPVVGVEPALGNVVIGADANRPASVIAPKASGRPAVAKERRVRACRTSYPCQFVARRRIRRVPPALQRT